MKRLSPVRAVAVSLLAGLIGAQRGHPGPAAIVTDALLEDRFPIQQLGLGDGGLSGTPLVWPRLAPGQAMTPSGILVRVRREGLKLDFPSGAELLVTPDGSVHLRDGSYSAPLRGPVELVLADRSRLVLRTTAAPRRPFDRVVLVADGRGLLLWQGRGPSHHNIAAARPAGVSLVVVGRGDAVYRAAVAGPVVALQRLVCPEARREALPELRAVVAGDVLRRGLRALPDHVPPAPVQFPQAPEAARTLASLAPVLFPAGALERPLGTLGELAFGLVGGFRLVCEQRGEALYLGLYRGEVAVPAVEWRCGPGAVGGAASLHLLRPDGGASGGPRYFLGGIDLSSDVREMLPFARSVASARAARDILGRLGARGFEQPSGLPLASSPSGR